MPPKIAYLAKGKLHLVEGPDAQPKVVESQFGQLVRDRAVRSSNAHSWKTQGRGARFMSGGALWGLPEQDPGAIRIAVTGLTRGAAPGQVVYSLETSEVAGLFAVDVASGEEKRLVHGNELRVQHPNGRPGVELLACCVPRPGGVCRLAVMRADGSDMLEVTEGDSVDQAPSWVPGQPEVVFQSAGIGRDRDGNFLAVGPFAIQRLHLKSGEMTPLAEDPACDLLSPRVSEDGTLHYIRRPYRGMPKVSPWRVALDVLLLPVRLIHAIFQFLNFFTVRYTGKPLTGGDARSRGADLKQMMIWGNLVDADREAREARDRGEDAPSLVPPAWQLVRKKPGGEPEVLAKGVLSFDLCADGSLVYSNGSAVYHLAEGGGPARLCKDEHIEQVVALG